MTQPDTRLRMMRGATFAFSAIYRDSVTLARISLAGTTVRSHVRSKASDEMLSAATITIDDEPEGEFSGEIAATATAKWPLGELFCNISYETGGVVVKTDAFAFTVEWSPTR